LNPRSVDKKIGISLFPPSNEFYDLAQGANFRQFLSIDGTTEDRQNTIAQHYGALDKWTASKHEGDHVNTCFELLLLVKTKNKSDKVQISFIEGLQRQAAIFTRLLCMKFDYSNNIIIPGSLQLDNFEKEQILDYKNPGITPKQQLALIVGNNFNMLIFLLMPIQVYIPIRVANPIGGTIQLLMEALKTQSEWVSISKKISETKQYQNSYHLGYLR
jgi:hypothetical protein